MKKLFSIFVLTSILVSCGSSNNVVQDGLFQKRKYTSGWFVKKNKGNTNKTVQQENLALKEPKEREYPSDKSNLSTNNGNVSHVINSVEKDKLASPESATVPVKHNAQKAESKPVSYTLRKNDQATTRNVKNNSNTGVETFGKEVTNSAVKKNRKNSNSNSSSDVAVILLIILCFILPPLAVWLATSDTTQLIISIVLTLLFWLPGIIHALLVVFGII